MKENILDAEGLRRRFEEIGRRLVKVEDVYKEFQNAFDDRNKIYDSGWVQILGPR